MGNLGWRSPVRGSEGLDSVLDVAVEGVRESIAQPMSFERIRDHRAVRQPRPPPAHSLTNQTKVYIPHQCCRVLRRGSPLPPAPTMRRILPLFLCASLVLAADDSSFWNVQLTSDASQRYMVNAQMASILTACLLHLSLTSWIPLPSPLVSLPKTSILSLPPVPRL